MGPIYTPKTVISPLALHQISKKSSHEILERFYKEYDVEVEKYLEFPRYFKINLLLKESIHCA